MIFNNKEINFTNERRYSLVQELTEKAVEAMDDHSLGCILQEGCIGYDNMEPEDIIQEWIDCQLFNEQDWDELVEQWEEEDKKIKVT